MKIDRVIEILKEDLKQIEQDKEREQAYKIAIECAEAIKGITPEMDNILSMYCDSCPYGRQSEHCAICNKKINDMYVDMERRIGDDDILGNDTH